MRAPIVTGAEAAQLGLVTEALPTERVPPRAWVSPTLDAPTLDPLR